MKIIFFGTPPFAAYQLNYLLEHEVNIAAVVTKPDRPQGRSKQPIPSAVKQIALSQKPPLPLFQPVSISEPDSAQQLKIFEADLFVVVAFGEIIKENLLTMPTIACINLHASLLPKYRGAAPIQRCIMNGEAQSGVTIMHMTKKMDAGDIISSLTLPIGTAMTYGELEQKLCIEGAPLLLKTIRDFERGHSHRQPQNHAEATYAAKIELEDCRIDWSKSAETVHALVRGVNPHPGAWCLVEIKGEQKRLRVIATEVIQTRNTPPGNICLDMSNALAVACGQNALRITQLQLEGKKAMHAEEFLRGIPMHTIKMSTGV